MSRDPYRPPSDLRRGDRYESDRFVAERERDRFGDERERIEERDRVYARGANGRVRERSVDDRFERRASRGGYEDDLVRDRRVVEEDVYGRRGRPEVDRRVVVEQERARQYVRSPSPPRRPPVLLRRQSSLDTFDRRPTTRFYERPEREEYGPPARREDVRGPSYIPEPLPRNRGLPPPRRYAERESYEEIKIADPEFYGDDEFRPYPERIREREVVHTRRRNRSRSRSRRGSSVRSSSRTSITSSTSSGSSVTTGRASYPKKGKTRIPARLVSRRALMELGYPYIEEGNVVIVQKALGQDNIDDLLKLSETYKRTEVDFVTARNANGATFVEERREERVVIDSGPGPAPFILPARPGPPGGVEVIDTTRTVVRDVSPARSYTTSASSHHHHHHHHNDGALYVKVRDSPVTEISADVPVGPLALVTDHRHRSRSRSDRDIRAEIRALESQLRGGPVVVRDSEREIVKAERLSDGQLVVYEDKVERIETPPRGVRIEKDKKGRMSISVPKRY